MGRTPAFSQQAPLFEAIKNCPVLSKVKLIAEPRDIGEGGYQVGNFPPLFAEWNDHFRDAVRRFWLTRDLSLGSLPVALPAPAISLSVTANVRRPPLTW